jgi:RNA polymerase sigma-70 factor (ECF subfamily)
MATDEELMARAGTGDRSAFAALMDRHLDRAVATAYRVLGNRADAEEAAQEAFLRVWVNAAKWRPDTAKFTTWLHRILVNHCIDRKRRPGMAPLEAAGDPADERPTAFDTLAANDDAERIRGAMAALPERQRAAIALCYWGGQGNIEAAASLGVTVGALESLLVRARRTLRERLSSAPETGTPPAAAGGR